MSNPVYSCFPVLQGFPITVDTSQPLSDFVDPQSAKIQDIVIGLLENNGVHQALKSAPNGLGIDQIFVAYLDNVSQHRVMMREDEEKEEHIKKREAVESQSNESQKGKKLREDQYEVLHKFYERKQYVTRDEAEQLSDQLGVPLKKIQQWFVTKRRSNKRKEERRKAREVEGYNAPSFIGSI